MPVKFLSEEWRAAVEEALKANLNPELMKHWDTALCMKFENCPDGKTYFFRAEFNQGVVGAVTVSETAPPSSEFVVSGQYEIFKEMFSGQLTAQDAMLGGKIKVHGNMIKAMELIPSLGGLYNALSNVKTIFE